MAWGYEQDQIVANYVELNIGETCETSAVTLMPHLPGHEFSFVLKRWSDQHDKVAQVHVRTHHLCRSIDQMVDHLYNMYPDLDRSVIEVHVKMWEDYYKKTW
ncbi:hypothetical protein CJU89_2299 [Yarrowia sp. B02]|nr:hypothetical protein CJU89_2299 [Yarrowia sp. B02]